MKTPEEAALRMSRDLALPDSVRDAIAALLRADRAAVREECIAWVGAFARDCGCSKRIEDAIRAWGERP